MRDRMMKVGRSPVLVLWAVVVAERLGFQHAEALTLGRALSGLAGQALALPADLFEPSPETLTDRRAKLAPGETLQIALMHRAVPVIHIDHAFRAVSKGRPINPQAVERYLAEKFDGGLDLVTAAMRRLANSLPPHELAIHAAELYRQFRPENGELDVDRIAAIVPLHSHEPSEAAFHLSDRSHESLDDVDPAEQPSFRGPQASASAGRLAEVEAPSRALMPRQAPPAGNGAAGRSLALLQLRSVQPEEEPVLPPPRPQWANRMGLVALTLVLLTLAAAGGGFVGAYLTAKSGTTLAARAPDMPAVPMIGATAEPAAERVAAVPANDSPAMADAATPKAEAPAPASEPVTVAAAAPPAEPAPRIDVAPAPVAPIVTADPEPTKSGPAATEVAIAEPIAADPPKAEPTKAEVVKVEPANNDTAMSGPSMAATVPAVPAQVVIMSMERGDELMKEGDIVGARRFYEIAASSGDPRAATAVGRTFDPAYLQQAGIRGPQSNSAKARQWYEKAMRGGDTEARLLLFRLSALSARH